MSIGLVSGNCNMGLMYLILVDQAAVDLLIFFCYRADSNVPCFQQWWPR